MINSYKDLQVWIKGTELVKDIYVMTKKLPKDELFGITSQMRRSAVSIPSNIAEGWMRQHTNEYVQFVFHALGSCSELDTQLMIIQRLGYIDQLEAAVPCEKLNHITRMLRNLVKGLRK